MGSIFRVSKGCSFQQLFGPLVLFSRGKRVEKFCCFRRSQYAYASTDDGVDEHRAAGSAFVDGIAAGSVIEPGQKLQIDTYSMSWDGDFVSNRRVVLLIEGERGEWFASISKLAGYLWDEQLHGLHLLKMVKSL